MRIISVDEGGLQGSEKWHSYRLSHIGSSEVGAIMGLNPWRSAVEVWREKTGQSRLAPLNAAIELGNRLEPICRIWYEELKGESYQPIVAEHDTIGYLSASLDGISVDRKRAIEIKCGAKSYQMAKDGIVQPYYYAQCQHIYLVTGVWSLDYVAFDPTQKEAPIIIPVEEDEAFGLHIETECFKFWDCVTNFISPLTLSRTYEVVHD